MSMLQQQMFNNLMTGGSSGSTGSQIPRFPIVPAALSHLLSPGLSGLSRQNGLPGLTLGLPGVGVGVGIPPPIAALAQTVSAATNPTTTTVTPAAGFPGITVSTTIVP